MSLVGTFSHLFLLAGRSVPEEPDGSCLPPCDGSRDGVSMITPATRAPRPEA